MLGIISLGLISFSRLGVSQLPDVDFPVVSVSLRMEGASPEVMEQDVVDILEDKLMGVEGVRKLTSSSKNGSANIGVEFDLSRNIDLAIQDVQSKVSQSMKTLPTQLDPPSISKTNPDDMPIVSLTVEAPGLSRRDLMVFVRDQIKDHFTTIEGVGAINIFGFVDPNMRIWIKEDQLKRHGLAVNDVISTLRTEQVDPPAGQIDFKDRQFNLRFFGEAVTPNEFEGLRVGRYGGQALDWSPPRLGEIARIEEGLADTNNTSRAMGRSAVSFGVIKQRGSNAVAVSQAIMARLEEVKKILPEGVSIAVNFDSTRFISEAVEDLNWTLLLSAVLTGIVCWAFLGTLASTINVLIAIPVSVIGSFTFFYFMGFTLNTFTLLALNLSIGIVVDDAIMVIENIVRHREKGKSPRKAALDGSREITFAAVAASISVIAIFLPVAFMRGLMGKFFFQFGVAMTVAVLLSLLEAITLTPMRASILKSQPHGPRRGVLKWVERFMELATVNYQWTLSRTINHPWKVLVFSLILTFLSVFTFRNLRQEFLPAQDQSRLSLRMQTPIGSSLSFTDEQVKPVEAFLAERPEVDRFYVTVGSNGQGGDTNNAMAFVTLKPKGKRGKDPETGRELTQSEFMQVVRKKFKGGKNLKVVVSDFSMRGLTTSRGFPVEFTIQGPNWEKLGELTTQAVQTISKMDFIADVDTDFKVGMPELKIVPNRKKVSEHTASLATIGETINAMISGMKVGQYSKDGHRYDVRIKLDSQDTDLVHRIKNLDIRNQAGNLVSLDNLVDIKEEPTVQAISRVNRTRSTSVYANVKPGFSQKTALEQVQKIVSPMLPSGYSMRFSGSAQSFSESFDSLIFALAMGLLVAYMILATQFNSFIHPFTVLMALPFSLVGAFIALWIFGQSLNIYSLIGLILLMGIAKKNSILLVDFTNQIRENEKLGIKDALVKACPIRLRPIIMTSTATIAGAIPAAFALGPGSETRIPMAITVIGGVLVSTIFTLYLVPSVYLLLSPFERREVEET